MSHGLGGIAHVTCLRDLSWAGGMILQSWLKVLGLELNCSESPWIPSEPADGAAAASPKPRPSPPGRGRPRTSRSQPLAVEAMGLGFAAGAFSH